MMFGILLLPFKILSFLFSLIGGAIGLAFSILGTIIGGMFGFFWVGLVIAGMIGLIRLITLGFRRI